MNNSETVSVTKNIDNYHYLKVKLVFEDGVDFQLTAAEFKNLLLSEAIGTLYGNVGCAAHLDILCYSEKTREAVLRLKTCEYQRIWAALTLLGYYGRHRCAIRVLKVSGHLIGINSTRCNEVYRDLIADR